MTATRLCLGWMWLSVFGLFTLPAWVYAGHGLLPGETPAPVALLVWLMPSAALLLLTAAYLRRGQADEDALVATNAALVLLTIHALILC